MPQFGVLCVNLWINKKGSRKAFIHTVKRKSLRTSYLTFYVNNWILGRIGVWQEFWAELVCGRNSGQNWCLHCINSWQNCSMAGLSKRFQSTMKSLWGVCHLPAIREFNYLDKNKKSYPVNFWGWLYIVRKSHYYNRQAAVEHLYWI